MPASFLPEAVSSPAPASFKRGAEVLTKRLRELDKELEHAWKADHFVAVLKRLESKDRAQQFTPQQIRALRDYVIDRALNRFMDLDEIDEMAKAVQDDASLRMVMAERLRHYAVHADKIQTAYAYGSRIGSVSHGKLIPENQKKFASRCAAGVLIALEKVYTQAPRRLGEFLSSLEAHEGRAFALALSGAHNWRKVPPSQAAADEHYAMALAIDRILSALNQAPSTDTANVIAENLLLQALPTDLVINLRTGRRPLSPQNVAKALAYIWHSPHALKGQAKMRAEAEIARTIPHVRDLLSSPLGAWLMFNHSSEWAIKQIFDVVRDNPAITAEILAGGDPLRHPVVTDALARKYITLANKEITVPTLAQDSAREAKVKRVSAVFRTEAGQNLLKGGAPEKAKLEAIAAIVSDDTITAETFTSDNPFANERLQKKIAPLYALSGSEQEYPGESGRNMIALAMGMTPVFPKGANISIEDSIGLVNAMAEGKALKDWPPKLRELFTQHALFPKDPQDVKDPREKLEIETVNKVMATISARAATHPPKFGVDINVVFTELGPVTTPVFRVQVAGKSENGGALYDYVDNIGRYYTRDKNGNSLENYLHRNKYPPGELYYTQHNAFGKRDANGVEELSHQPTPATHDKIGRALDTAAYVGCLAAGVVGVVVSGGTLALAAGAVGIAGTTWSTARGIQDILDRQRHGQTGDADYYMAVADAVTNGAAMIVFGGTVGLAGLQALGVISQNAKWVRPVIGGLHGAGTVADVSGMAATLIYLNDKSEEIADEELKKALGQLLFFGVLGVKDARQLAIALLERARTSAPLDHNKLRTKKPKPPEPAKLPVARVVSRRGDSAARRSSPEVQARVDARRAQLRHPNPKERLEAIRAIARDPKLSREQRLEALNVIFNDPELNPAVASSESARADRNAPAQSAETQAGSLSADEELRLRRDVVLLTFEIDRLQSQVIEMKKRLDAIHGKLNDPGVAEGEKAELRGEQKKLKTELEGPEKDLRTLRDQRVGLNYKIPYTPGETIPGEVAPGVVVKPPEAVQLPHKEPKPVDAKAQLLGRARELGVSRIHPQFTPEKLVALRPPRPRPGETQNQANKRGLAEAQKLVYEHSVDFNNVRRTLALYGIPVSRAGDPLPPEYLPRVRLITETHDFLSQKAKNTNENQKITDDMIRGAAIADKIEAALAKWPGAGKERSPEEIANKIFTLAQENGLDQITAQRLRTKLGEMLRSLVPPNNPPPGSGSPPPPPQSPSPGSPPNGGTTPEGGGPGGPAPAATNPAAASPPKPNGGPTDARGRPSGMTVPVINPDEVSKRAPNNKPEREPAILARTGTDDHNWHPAREVVEGATSPAANTSPDALRTRAMAGSGGSDNEGGSGGGPTNRNRPVNSNGPGGAGGGGSKGPVRRRPARAGESTLNYTQVVRLANSLCQITGGTAGIPGLLNYEKQKRFEELLIQKINHFAMEQKNPNITLKDFLRIVAEVGRHPDINLTPENVAHISKLIMANQPRTEMSHDGVALPLTAKPQPDTLLSANDLIEALKPPTLGY